MRRPTLAVIVASVISALIVALCVWFIVIAARSDSQQLLNIGMAVIVALCILTPTMLLFWGVYKKNRAALVIAIPLYSLVWGLAPGDEASKHSALATVHLVVALLLAIGTAVIFIRELVRNWHKKAS